MIYIILFFLSILFDSQILFGDSKAPDLFAILVLFIGIIVYLPLKGNRFYFFTLSKKQGLNLFSIFVIIIVISIFRTNNPSFSDFNILRNVFIIIFIPILIYFVFQKYVVEGKKKIDIFLLIPVHLLAIFSFVNFVSVFFIHLRGVERSSLLNFLGISSNKIIFGLYPDVHPNIIGSLGGLLFVFSLSYLIIVDNKSFIPKVLFWFYVFLGLSIVIIGDSRGTFFTCVLCVIVITSFFKFKILSLLKYSVFVIPISHLIFVSAIGILSSSNVFGSLSRNNTELATGNSRKFIYETVNHELSDIKLIHLFGYGEYGLYGADLTKSYIYRFGHDLTTTEKVIISVAHNSSIQAIFDTGYIGLIIFLLLLWVLLKYSIFLTSNTNPLFLTSLLLFFYIIVAGVTESYFNKYFKVFFYLFIYYGFIIILSYNLIIGSLFVNKSFNNEE